MVSTTESHTPTEESNAKENRLLLSKEDPKLMSHSSLTIISEESSSPELMDENDFDGSRVLEAAKERLATPTKIKTKSTPKTPQAPKKAARPKTPETIVTAQIHGKTDLAKVGLPSKFDVLCGQSRICANHTGNRRFKIILDLYASKYQAANQAVKSKQEKMMLTKEIVRCIASSGGRFLKYKDGMWTEISDETARDKVSHALRTKLQSWKRQQAEKESSSPKKRGFTLKRRPRRRRSAPSSAAPNMSEVRAVSFDGSDRSSIFSSAIMDELLRAQREIFEQLTQNDKANAPKQTHPLKRTGTWL